MARVSDPSDQFLEHYGIPGMKWGKRSAKGKGGKSSKPKQVATPFPKTRPDYVPKGVTDLSPKPVKKIPDKELRERINRMQMETQYKDLTEGKGKSDVSKAKKTLKTLDTGHTFVKNVMSVAKTAQTIHKFANSELVKDISKMMKELQD